MMKNFGLMLFAALFLAFGSNVMNAQSESSNGASHIEAELGLVVHNDCCDEDVQLGGTVYYVSTKNGGHVNSRGNNVTGTGTSGRTYTGSYVGMRNTAENEKGQKSQTQVQTFRLTSEDGCSFTVHVRIHTTVNAAGETVVETDVTDVTCDDGDSEEVE